MAGGAGCIEAGTPPDQIPQEIMMSDRTVSAVFDSRSEAERALAELRSAGIPENSISIIGRGETGDDDDGVNKSGALKGALGGAGVGTLLGIAALAIPGVGPLVAAGAIASSAIPGAAAIGAAAGAATGGLAGLLTEHGVDDEDSRYYEARLGEGGIFLAVHADDAGVPLETAREILFRNGGHSASRARTTAAQ
jgi:hypothetical protein